MNHLKTLINTSNRFIRTNSPTILTGIGVGGTLTTAYLAANAGYLAAKRIANVPGEITLGEKFEQTWDLYIPAATSCVVTVGAIIIASRVSSKRAAAAYSILAVSERAFEEYREKVTEVLGDKKEQALRDEIIQARVNETPPSLVISDSSGVICCELHTGRYFKSDMETLRKAQNDINVRINRDLYVTLDEFYYILGIDATTTSGNLGWDSGKLLELIFTVVMTPDNKPCLAFSYNYLKPI